MVIGLGKDILVLTGGGGAVNGARLFPCTPPPLHMAGGIFRPVNIDWLCQTFPTSLPQPFVIFYNGRDHYDSTVKLHI